MAEVLNHLAPLILLATAFMIIFRGAGRLLLIPLVILLLAALFPQDRGVQVAAQFVLVNLGGILVLALAIYLLRAFGRGR